MRDKSEKEKREGGRLTTVVETVKRSVGLRSVSCLCEGFSELTAHSNGGQILTIL